MQKVQTQSIVLPTTLGCGSLVVWSFYAFVVSEVLISLPIFQTLFLMFFAGFLIMAVRLTVTQRWRVIKKQPLLIWLVGIIGICGSDIAYITAVKYAPPAHVDFIDYLWPFLVILFSSFLPKERFTWQHLIAGSLGFLGVFLMLSGGEGFLGFKPDYFWGYIFALTAAIIWSLYTIANRWFQEMPIEMVGMFCGVGALVSLVIHGSYETWVMPSVSQGVMVCMLGLSSGVAYIFWSYGTQKGNIKLLGILAYFTPIISMSLLVSSGKEPMSIALVLACLLVISGVVVGSVDWSWLKRLTS